MTQPEIRPFRAEDLDRVIAGIPSEAPDAHRRRLEAQDRGELICLVAWLEAGPVGFGAVFLANDRSPEEEMIESRGLPMVDYLLVEGSFRRRGIARALMLALEEEARVAGAPAVMLDVAAGDDAAPARALYRSLGYEPLGGTYLGGWSDPDRPGVHLLDALTLWVKPISSGVS